MNAVQTIAKRYAKALFSIAHELDAVAAIGDDVRAVAEVIAVKEVRAFVLHPSIPVQKKHAVFASRLQQSVFDAVRSLVHVLIDRKRLVILPAIADAYDGLADESLRRTRAHVTSAFALSRAQIQAIGDVYEKLLGTTVVVRTSVDASLLGGICVQVGDTLIDGSIVAHLARMQQQIGQRTGSI
jgi:F-type H+-transporting ATPase subunit delta